MSSHATPSDPTTRPRLSSGRWRDDEPTPTGTAPLQFSTTCRHRLPNTVDAENEYDGRRAR